MIADVLQTFPNALMIHSFQNRNEFITTITTCKKFFRYCLTELDCKRANILVPFVMSQIIVDRSQIIQIKHTHCHQLVLRYRLRLIQNLLTFVFVWKSRSLIQIDFFLQNLILCSKTYHLYQFRSNDQYQSQNINQYDFFQMIQSGRFFL